MEKQSTKYLLAIAVIAIWGLLGYRIYKKVYPDNDFFIPPTSNFALEENIAADSFQLLVNYRDPFLEDKIKQRQKPTKPERQVNVLQPTKKFNVAKSKKVTFPKLTYKGSIYLESGRKVALVSFNKQMVNLGLGESFEEITLLAIQEDSIRLRFEGQEKTFFKGSLTPKKK
ncbi:MAG: hypothetical protein AB8G15_03715 [Saprospiraceae bacterium]